MAVIVQKYILLLGSSHLFSQASNGTFNQMLPDAPVKLSPSPFDFDIDYAIQDAIDFLDYHGELQIAQKQKQKNISTGKDTDTYDQTRDT